MALMLFGPRGERRVTTSRIDASSRLRQVEMRGSLGLFLGLVLRAKALGAEGVSVHWVMPPLRGALALPVQTLPELNRKQPFLVLGTVGMAHIRRIAEALKS